MYRKNAVFNGKQKHMKPLPVQSSPALKGFWWYRISVFMPLKKIWGPSIF
jgi:hypothetical protein